MGNFRQMPFNNEAEQATLGAMLIAEYAVEKVSSILTPEDFYRAEHSIIFSSMVDLYRRHTAVDIVTVSEDLETKSLLEKAGGLELLTRLSDTVPTSANVMYYANIVKEKSHLRSFINRATEIAGMAYNGEDPEVIQEFVNTNLFSLESIGDRAQGSSLRDIIMNVIDHAGKIKDGELDVGISTGYKDLDKIITGFKPSDYILLAARPSMGKTAFATNLALNVLLAGKHVAFFSLEMSADSIGRRLVSQYSGRHFNEKMTEQEYGDFCRFCNEVYNLPLYINEHKLSISEIRNISRKLKRDGELDFIVIDYMQLIESDIKASSADGRHNEIARISKELKLMAKELNVPILCLSQLNRASENRNDKRPMLSDLRESGALEQDADIVMLLHRDEYYNRTPENAKKANVIIAKHRNGPVGTINLYFECTCTNFYDMDADQVPSSAQLLGTKSTKMEAQEAQELFND